MPTNELDFAARYRVSGWPKIAVYVTGYYSEPDKDTEWSGIERVDESRVRVVMVGDDREHIVDIDDLIYLPEDEFCSCCGQIGCGWG